MSRLTFTVEGETLTVAEVCARLPGITETTVRNRLGTGKRTWGELSKPINRACQEVASRPRGPRVSFDDVVAKHAEALRLARVLARSRRPAVNPAPHGLVARIGA